MPTTLQDARQSGWFWIEDALIDHYGHQIGAIGVAVYAYLARRADRQGVCFPSYNTIARDLKLSRRTVITYIQLLEKHGLVIAQKRTVKGRGHAANAYQLVNVRPPAQNSVPAPSTPEEGDPPGAGNAPGQEVHHPGATHSPGPVQELHHPGAAVAPEGNTEKETQEKETQKKEKKIDPVRMCEVAGENDPALALQDGVGVVSGVEGGVSAHSGEIAALMEALAGVTGRDLSLLRPAKQDGFRQTARLLSARGYTAADVRDFALYWREAHLIGSKDGAGQPHLVQVQEDLPTAMPWIVERRERQAERAAWAEMTWPQAGPAASAGPVDAAAVELWKAMREHLRLRLGSIPAAADLPRARALSLAGDLLVVQMPDPLRAQWWQERPRRPLAECAQRAAGRAIHVRFTHPHEER